ncbi:MAG: molybdopterin-dependent oxidoreductase, partial [Anaerolineae bacterium]
IVLYGPALVSGAQAATNRASLFNFALLAGCAERTYYLAPEANSIGARDMGLLPASLPGHAATSDDASRERLERQWGARLPASAGLGYEAMLTAAASGELRALYLVGSDPAAQSPAAQAALQALDFVVVQDLFMTTSAGLADVVLPAVSWAETDGTYTNLERRVQRAPQAIRHPNTDAAPDWLILSELGKQWANFTPQTVQMEGKKKGRKVGDLAAQWAFTSAQAVLDEITRAVPLYDKLTWVALGEQGQQWPWEGARSDAGRGAVALPVPARRLTVPAARVVTTNQDYPYALVASRLLFDGGTLLRKNEVAAQVAVAAAVGVNPADAAREQWTSGQWLTVTSPAGQLSLPVRLDATVQPGTVWIPYSLPGAPVETLLNSADDGVGTRVRITPQKVG